MLYIYIYIHIYRCIQYIKNIYIIYISVDVYLETILDSLRDDDHEEDDDDDKDTKER
jgi:hypothetical protein